MSSRVRFVLQGVSVSLVAIVTTVGAAGPGGASAVTATDGAASGPGLSVPSASLRVSAPGPVRNLRAIPRGRDIDIEWREPVRNGGPKVLNYEFRVNEGAWRATRWPWAVLRQMDWNRTVRIEVRAVNDWGLGVTSSVWATPMKVETGQPNPKLPICGKDVESGAFPNPVFGAKCRAPATLDAVLVKGSNGMTFSRYDKRRHHWNYRVTSPNRNWQLVGKLFVRTASGKLKELDDWYHDNGEESYGKFHAYIYPSVLGAGTFVITSKIWLKWTTEYTWVRTSETQGAYQPTRKTELTDNESLTIYIN